MYAELVMARVTTAAEAAEGAFCKKFWVESMHFGPTAGDYVITSDGADPFEVINTWEGPIPIGTTLIIGRLSCGEWVVISEACEA